MKERTNERKQPSQLDRILAVLESGGTLTALDALEDFGCSRLASRITDLKRKGYPVASRMVTRRNRYGRLCRVAEYYMELKNGKRGLHQAIQKNARMGLV